MAKTWRNSGQTEIKFSDRKKQFVGDAIVRKGQKHANKKTFTRTDKTKESLWLKS
jgi:hypothetical protein